MIPSMCVLRDVLAVGRICFWFASEHFHSEAGFEPQPVRVHQRQRACLFIYPLVWNRIKETSALVLMDALKKDNTTLKHCHLDFNQLGSTGGRAVAAIKDDKENGCNITMANCSFQDVGGKGGDFNPEDPNG